MNNPNQPKPGQPQQGNPRPGQQQGGGGQKPGQQHRVAANRSLLSSRDRAVIREVSKAAWTAKLDAAVITDGPAGAAGPFH